MNQPDRSRGRGRPRILPASLLLIVAIPILGILIALPLWWLAVTARHLYLVLVVAALLLLAARGRFTRRG